MTAETAGAMGKHCLQHGDREGEGDLHVQYKLQMPFKWACGMMTLSVIEKERTRQKYSSRRKKYGKQRQWN